MTSGPISLTVGWIMSHEPSIQATGFAHASPPRLTLRISALLPSPPRHWPT
jgi:hypothetical protein